MAIIFPPLESSSPEGLLAIGGTLDSETLLTAYKQGIFPWPISHDSPLTWFSPDPRGILFLKDFHLSKSLKRFIKSTDYTVTFNKDFKSVLENCAHTKRTHETGTWITQNIIDGYVDFFNKGYAYSIEVWNGKKLIGGLYGVTIGKYVSGESMFHLETNASKIALYGLISVLKLRGIEWLDTQMVTPVIEAMGGSHLARKEFIELLNQSTIAKINRDDIFDESVNLPNQF